MPESNAQDAGIGYRAELAREIGPMVRLAWPVVVAELGWMAMGLVDTLMVGPLGAEAIAAVGLGHSLFFAVTIFGIGLLFGLDTLVAQAFGAGRFDDCRRILSAGIWLALAMTPPMIGLLVILTPMTRRFGVAPELIGPTTLYVRIVAWSTPTLLVFTAVRRYLQAIGVVRPIMIVLLTANGINALVNWTLIHGNLGMPRLGIAGAAWATFASRLYMLVVLGWVLWQHDRGRDPAGRGLHLGFEPARILGLVRLGWSAAVHLLLEVGVFVLATLLAGVLGAIDLAAHQVVLNVCGFTFMVPLGLSSAGAVRVGHAIGRGDPRGAATSGWTALLLGVGFMSLSATAFLLGGSALVRAFTSDPDVIRVGVPLFAIAAAFQLFDGIQVVATGNLRGAGDTRTPMLSNLVTYWGIGLPVGYGLAFAAGQRIFGLWIGLCLGLVLTGCVLLWAWWRRTSRGGPALVRPELA